MRQKPELFTTEIKGVDSLFSDIPEESPIAQLIQISNIKLPQKQPRRYFDPDALAALVISIEKNGILQPLVVRPLGDQQYELVAGERRFRASQKTGLTEVPCVIRELSEDEAYELALVENLQREDLNPVDETEGILELLERLLDQPQEDIKILFSQANHKNRASGNNVITTKEWQTIEQVFQRISKITPQSFAANRLPLLNMPEEILESVRAGDLEYTKAKLIGRIKDARARQELLSEAIDEQLSLTAIKQKITAAKTIDKKPPKVAVQKTLRRMESLYKEARKPEYWKKGDKRQKLESILNELEQLLNSE